MNLWALQSKMHGSKAWVRAILSLWASCERDEGVCEPDVLGVDPGEESPVVVDGPARGKDAGHL